MKTISISPHEAEERIENVFRIGYFKIQSYYARVSTATFRRA